MMLYSGGAHPGEESFAYSFSLNDGNMLRINKLFKNGYQDELTHRIKLKLMEMQNVETEKELNARGFEEIGISPYFLLEKDGIIFRYESYTIAPFYVGDIDIKFSASAFKIHLFTHTEFREDLISKIITYFFTYYKSETLICIHQINSVNIRLHAAFNRIQHI